MTLLPEKMRFRLFADLSTRTMRYVSDISYANADGRLKEIYDQINRDFFINGSLTSRAKVTNIIAAAWVIGREAILVDDLVDRTTKEAIAAVLSNMNHCPYCGDMLVSLVHAGNRSDDAMKILDEAEDTIDDPQLKTRLAWVKALVSASDEQPVTPFSKAQLPEVLASIMAMSDINRFSHIVMAGSSVKVPFNASQLRKSVLKMFGNELEPNHQQALSKGDSLSLLPEATLPEDMSWASQNPRIAQAVARWVATTEDEASRLITPAVKQRVHSQLQAWDGQAMPMGRHWVADETYGLAGHDKQIATYALLLAKAPWTIDEEMSEELLRMAESEQNFIRLLAWCSYASARHLANRIARSLPELNPVSAA